jgi:tetratricopeptide (TPR) repeat protein
MGGLRVRSARRLISVLGYASTPAVYFLFGRKYGTTRSSTIPFLATLNSIMNFGLALARHFRFSCSPRFFTASLITALVWVGCGGASFRERKDLSFGSAVQASLDESWEKAAEAAYLYLNTSSPDDPRYDRALLLLAQAAEKLGLSYAASLWYLDIAQSRRKVELLDKAISGLERVVMGGPHDEETLVRGFLATADISDLSAENLAFINYLQGLYSVRDGLNQWADQQFAAIPKTSPYFIRARYVQGVRALARKEWNDARQILKGILKEKALPEDIHNETELALARLAMEEGLYPEAIKHYRRVRRLAPNRPELLLEMAWAHYYRGEARRALGLLIALDAPVYRGLIAPERYLLEAFCLRQLCQFEPARTAAVRLRVSYSDALKDLHAGLSPSDSESLRISARQRGTARPLWLFFDKLNREKALAARLSLGERLSKDLKKLYGVGIKEANRRSEKAIEAETRALADELVSAETGVRLILHELSVGLLRGRQRPPGIEAMIESKEGPRKPEVMYRFVGEFWTDELDSLVVDIPDRCLE